MVVHGVGNELITSSAPTTRAASLMALVSTTHVNPFPYFPPDGRPCGPLSSCSIIHPALRSETPYVAARLARTCGLTLTTNTLLSPHTEVFPLQRLPQEVLEPCDLVEKNDG